MDIKNIPSRIPDQLRNMEIDAEQINTSEAKTAKEVGAKEIGNSHLDRIIGSGTGQGTGGAVSFLDGLKQSSAEAAGSRNRAQELMGDAHGGFVGAPSGKVSEDPAEGGDGSGVASPSVKDIIVNFFVGLGTSKSPLPAPPVPPDPETGKNMWDGVGFFKDVLGIGNYENYVNKRGGIDENGTPIRDADPVGPPTFITPEILRGLEARRGAKGEPNPESQAGSGGPVDESKTTGAASGPAGEPAIEVDRAVVTARDVDALRIRLESKFKSNT